jgi:DNA-3-methyladenine glycosylase
MTLPRTFYDRPTLVVARDLIGKVLVCRGKAGTTAGAIVEVEAYVGEADAACHASAGRTVRNAPLYGPPGFAYVYLSYGIHSLFNIVTERDGQPAAVLVRALVPLDGIALMERRRRPDRRRNGRIPDHELCRGPGSVARAMGITLADNRTDLCGPRLLVEDRGMVYPDVAWSSRIGISAGTEHPWRCFVVGCTAVSGRSRLKARDSRLREEPRNPVA